MENGGRAGQATDDVMRRMSFECRTAQTRTQTHTHIVWYLLLLYDNKGYAKAPYYYALCTLLLMYRFIKVYILDT